MADRYPQASSGGGISLSEDVGAVPGVAGDQLLLGVAIDPANLDEATTLADADLLVVGVGGVPKSITWANLKAMLGLPVISSFVVVWPGSPAAASAGTQGAVQVALRGVAGKVNRIVGLKIMGTGEKFGASGQTRITVSDMPYGTLGATTETAAIAYDAGASDYIPCDITLGSPPDFYVYPVENCGHADIKVQIDVEVGG